MQIKVVQLTKMKVIFSKMIPTNMLWNKTEIHERATDKTKLLNKTVSYSEEDPDLSPHCFRQIILIPKVWLHHRNHFKRLYYTQSLCSSKWWASWSRRKSVPEAVKVHVLHEQDAKRFRYSLSSPRHGHTYASLTIHLHIINSTLLFNLQRRCTRCVLHLVFHRFFPTNRAHHIMYKQQQTWAT